MTHLLRTILLTGLVALALPAVATYHTYQIDEIYSNADGTVQYVVLHESMGMNGQNLLFGHALLSTGAGGMATYLFSSSLPGGSCSSYGYGYGYGCNPAPTAFSHVLIATRGFVSLGIMTPDFVMPDGFLSTGGGTLNYAGVDQWTYGMLPTDGTNALFRDGSVRTNAAMNYSGVTVSVTVAAPPALNYQGLWWKPDESGWGINFAHQGDLIYATWYTYDTSGNPYWLSMLASRTAQGASSFHGDINVFTGPPFNNFAGIPPHNKVGEGTITFSDANNGTFAYDVNMGTAGATTAISQSKPITRYVLGGPAPQPVCTFGNAPDFAAATNYQDLWWNPSENGWGINFAHQGDQIYATWYTYDAKVAGNNNPLWLSALMQRKAANVFTGPIIRYKGTRFDNFKATDVGQTTVGDATLTFVDGNNATFRYTTNGSESLPIVDQTKSITRFLFVQPAGTTCN